MSFDRWEPVYEAILADFGYERTADERARDELEALLADRPTLEPDAAFEGRTVAIAGGGSSLEAEADVAAGADVVVAAGTALERLPPLGIGVDWVVTDLDKHAEALVEATHDGIAAAVHAHGDNRDLLETYVPRLDAAAVLPTTQAAPAGAVFNFSGFTDGDRAAFLADAFGAEGLVFPGWDFEDETVDPAKRRKLGWAERLLRWLEGRRDERFAVLDGRRDAIEELPGIEF